MSPFVASGTGLLLRRRALALLPVALAVTAGLQWLSRVGTEPRPSHRPALAVVGASQDGGPGLAIAHRAWVEDHGVGCARSFEHVLPYTGLATPLDRWGTPYALVCDHAGWSRRDGQEHILVRVISAGPDREMGTFDDVLDLDDQPIYR